MQANSNKPRAKRVTRDWMLKVETDDLTECVHVVEAGPVANLLERLLDYDESDYDLEPERFERGARALAEARALVLKLRIA